MAKDNIMSRAAKFRKTAAGKHMTQSEAVSHLSKSGKSHAKVSGKKTSIGKKAKPRNKILIIEEKRATKRKTGDATLNRALKLQQEIERMEKQRSKQTTKQMKDTFALAINAKHKEIRNIQQQLRARK